MKKLTEIANSCKTDKGSVHDESHMFTEFYNDIFEEYKQKAINENRKLNILEIGIYRGASLHMFNEFFGDTANLYGIDISLKQNNYYNDEIKLFEVDANNKEQIDNFLNEIGNIQFDIILEDASHISEHQIHTLLYFYKNVKSDGIYILEDLHVGTIKRTNSPLYYLMFNDKLSFMTEEEHNEFQNIIKTITIYVNKNERSNYERQSITSVITFKQ